MRYVSLTILLLATLAGQDAHAAETGRAGTQGSALIRSLGRASGAAIVHKAAIIELKLSRLSPTATCWTVTTSQLPAVERLTATPAVRPCAATPRGGHPRSTVSPRAP